MKAINYRKLAFWRIHDTSAATYLSGMILSDNFSVGTPGEALCSSPVIEQPDGLWISDGCVYELLGQGDRVTQDGYPDEYVTSVRDRQVAGGRELTEQLLKDSEI